MDCISVNVACDHAVCIVGTNHTTPFCGTVFGVRFRHQILAHKVETDCPSPNWRARIWARIPAPVSGPKLVPEIGPRGGSPLFCCDPLSHSHHRLVCARAGGGRRGFRQACLQAPLVCCPSTGRRSVGVACLVLSSTSSTRRFVV